MNVKQTLLEYIRDYANEEPVNEGKLIYYDFDDKKILCYDKKISVAYYPSSDILQVIDIKSEPPVVLKNTKLKVELDVAENYIDFLLKQRAKGEI